MPHASWPRWRSSHQQRAAQPVPVVVGEDERVVADARPRRRPRRACSGSGSGWRPPTRRIVGRRGEVALGVEVHGAGHVARLVLGARAAVDEHGAHSAPRGGDASASTSCSGKRCAERARAAVGIVRPDDHGRPGAGERRAARSRAAGSARTASSVGDGRYGSCSRSSSAAAKSAASPVGGARAEQRGAPGVRGGVGVRHGRGERAARRLGRGALARDERRRA